MFAYIKGAITHKTPTLLYIETPNQIAYEIQISLNTYQKIQKEDSCKLFIYTHFKKDGQNVSGIELYGFADTDEKLLFEHLISVSGIGANTARVLLSSLTPEEARGAILTDNERVIQSVKGIGPKTAKRVILELKDKLAKTTDFSKITSIEHNTVKDEALNALTMLGFQKSNIISAINTIFKTEPNVSVEELIKKCLRIL